MSLTKVSHSMITGAPINVLDFGADPSGVTDSTTAIQTAINSLAQGTVIFPQGTYLISSSLTCSYNILLVGLSKQTIIKANAVMPVMLYYDGDPIVGAGAYNQGQITNLKFNGNSLAAIGISSGGVNYLQGCLFTGVGAFSCVEYGMITLDNCWLNSFVNCNFNNNGIHGFFLAGGDNAGENINFFGCGFFNNTQYGIYIQPPGSGGASIFFHGCSFDYNGSWGIENGETILGGANVVLSGCHIEQPGLYIQNFGIMDCYGVAMYNGSDSGTLGYLIKNDGILNISGGWIQNAGSGIIFEPGNNDIFAFKVNGLPYSFPLTETPGVPIVSGTTYQNNQASPITLSVPITFGIGLGTISAFTGPTNPPTILVNQFTGNNNSIQNFITFTIAAWSFYKLEASAAPTAFINAGHIIQTY